MKNPENILQTLERERAYFFDHQAELVEQYYGTYIVIVGEKVVGAYLDELNAYEFAKKQYAPGTFLIQHCLPKEELVVLRFSTPFLYAQG